MKKGMDSGKAGFNAENAKAQSQDAEKEKYWQSPGSVEWA